MLSDVTAFLMWAAEPHLEARKRLGFKAILFLLLFAGLLYFTKKKIWAQSGIRTRRRKQPSTSSIVKGPSRGLFLRKPEESKMGLDEALIRSMPRTLLGALSGFAFGHRRRALCRHLLVVDPERLFVFSAAGPVPRFFC